MKVFSFNFVFRTLPLSPPDQLGQKVFAQNICIDFLAELDNFKKIFYSFNPYLHILSIDSHFVD